MFLNNLIVLVCNFCFSNSTSNKANIFLGLIKYELNSLLGASHLVDYISIHIRFDLERYLLNMLVVQQADFEKIKSEYDVTILIIAANCIGHCHYLYDFILCILALHCFASKITTICFNSESVTANKNLLMSAAVGRYVSCTTGRFT